MNSFMSLFAIFVVFIQIQISMSQTIQSPPGNNLIQQLCKRNHYQTLCISTLNLDSRSKTSNLQGLASISVDAMAKKVNQTLTYYIDVLRNSGGRTSFEIYGTCVEEYGAADSRFVPAVVADLKVKRYPQAMVDIKDIIAVPPHCEAQFFGSDPVTVTSRARNKAVHDIADMTADIIKTLIK